ncbi:ATP-binding protein [Alloyangia pacifica]|uniref:histidine kinase n=1 Tax=Alloyangia pacifica TaxID=311180 RepID=A0A1I6SVJ0_9RHOB|nr:ATP-binding protein [Alloyangia pacifica]SDG88978.1 PAS fold-containing protein [Alloyangia pacifica]SFS80929.1 PAS fold-containing protein [Alloyangia pacifica]
MRLPFYPKRKPDRASGADISDDYDLAQREAGRKALFEIIDDGFCIIQFIDGPDGPLSDYVHIEANSGYERHTGIKGIVGKTVFDVSPDDGREWVKIYGAVLESGVPIRFERDFVEAGRFIEVSARRLEPKSLGQVAVLFRDITARKQAEAELRESEKTALENEQRVNMALEAGAIVGTWVGHFPEETFIVDEGLSVAMGFASNDELNNSKLPELTENVHPEDKPRLHAAVDAALKNGGAYFQQFRVMRSDRKYHWIEASGKVTLGEQGQAVSFSGVLMDISGRREIEAERDRVSAELYRLNETLERRVEEQTAELMAKEEVLRQSHKMEAVGQLTGGLAHDFNNLLAAISGSLEMAKSRLSENRYDEIERYLSAGKSAAQRAANVTQRLLAFARKQTLEPKVTDLSLLCEGLSELIQRTVGPGVDIQTSFVQDAWPALVDRNQLENALLNLCINARDAMNSSGSLKIHVSNTSIPADRAEGLDLSGGDYVQISVVDTGTGMTPQQIDRAFDPFYTTKPMGEGTGLGLSMVYGFAQQSGGASEIQSEPGVGTTVTLYLPRSLAETEVVQEQPSVSERTTREGAKRSILVVEDEVLVRMVVVDALEDRGFMVFQSGTGSEALEILRSDVRVDVLLTDVGLPKGMNGHQLAEAARLERPDLKIIFVTGYDETAGLGSNLPPGDVEIVHKPFDLEVLIGKVSRLSHSGI